MSQPQVNPYLRTKIMTASAEELRLMLYDGAIKFCRQAHDALGKKDFESSFNAIGRAQKIVLELSTSLNHNIAPELCDRLGALYTYIYRRLVDANIEHDVAPLDEAITLLDFERETWRMLMHQTDDAGVQAEQQPQAQANVAGVQQATISSLSVNG